MSWTLTTSRACIIKAGTGANTTASLSGAMLQTWSDAAEGVICAATHKDWITDYSTIKANFKGILDDLASDMVAMQIVKYDMSGYTSRYEAETMLDVMRDNVQRNISVLNDDKNKQAMET